MITVDYYAKFDAAKNLRKCQSETVISKCKKTFSQSVTPKELIMDYGPEFSSHKFCSFSKTFDILHKTISPHYHQLNALTKRSIQTVKRTLRKAKLYSEHPFLSVLSLNSQLNKNRTSPTEKVFGHKLKATLPSLTPSTQNVATEKPTVTQNLRCKLPEIAPGTTVRNRTDEQNLLDKKGTVIS